MGEVGYNDHQTSVPRVSWPTLAEVQSWAASANYATASAWHTTAVASLQMALDAAIGRLSERCGLTGLADEQIKPQMKLATIMQAYKWYDRHKTPTGTVGQTEFGAVVRTAALDHDVEQMISNDVLLGLA